MDTNIKGNDTGFPFEGGADRPAAELAARKPSQQARFESLFEMLCETLFERPSDGQWWSDELHDQFAQTVALVSRVRALDPRQARFSDAEQNDGTRGVQSSRMSSTGFWFPLNNADQSVPDELMREMWPEFSDSWQEMQRAGSERSTDSIAYHADPPPSRDKRPNPPS